MTVCGRVALAGRPNVGKSTLLNRFVGTKVTPVSDKPQTSWFNISGIVTQGDAQIVYVDTPGLHRGGRRLLNRVMNANAERALESVDLVLLLVEALTWNDEDEHVLAQVRRAGTPYVVVATKVDRVRDKSRLLPYLGRLSGIMGDVEIVPVSARRSTNLEVLAKVVRDRLPESAFLYPEDQLSGSTTRFLVSELIREQLVRSLREELPYAAFVEIESFVESKDRLEVQAVIRVDRSSQRAIIIGKKGRTLKHVGTEARRSIEGLLGVKVVLKLWVRDKPGWQDDARVLSTLDEPGA